MDELTTVETTPQQSTEYEAAMEHYLTDIRRLRQEMADSQRRIEQSRAETRALLDSTRALLDKLAAS